MTITYWNDRTAATTMVELLLLGIYTRIGNRGSKTQNQVISDDGVKVATVRSMGEEEEEREKKKKLYHAVGSMGLALFHFLFLPWLSRLRTTAKT